MPRPRRWKSFRITSFYIPSEYEDLIQKAEELAKRDDITLSEIILRALAEYIERHYPGNPQTSFDTWLGKAPIAATLEAKKYAQELQEYLNNFKKIDRSRLDRFFWRDKLYDLSIKLARVNRIVKEKKYLQLIKEAMKILEEM